MVIEMGTKHSAKEKKFEILSLLQHSSEQFLSGEELSRKLGVSRNAVWKMVNALRSDGYQIEAVTNKGYHLKSSPALISSYEIQRRISTKWIGGSIEVLDSVSSTNEYAKSLLSQQSMEALNGHVIFANRQTSGKAKQNARFYSPEETGIYITVIFCPDVAITYFESLRNAVAEAALAAIRQVTEIRAELLPPNELIYEGKKLAGFLTDILLEGESGKIKSAIVGLGIYVNEAQFPPELETCYISLQQIAGKPVDRLELLCHYLTELEQRIPAEFFCKMAKTENGSVENDRGDI